MVRKQKKKPAEKGHKIMIMGGVYDGLYGWFDVSRQETSKMYPIIVTLEDGSEHVTRVRKSNVSQYRKPATYGERILFENRDIAKLMTKLCYKLAECDLKHENHQTEIVNIFVDGLSQAIVNNSGRITRMTSRKS